MPKSPEFSHTRQCPAPASPVGTGHSCRRLLLYLEAEIAPRGRRIHCRSLELNKIEVAIFQSRIIAIIARSVEDDEVSHVDRRVLSLGIEMHVVVGIPIDIGTIVACFLVEWTSGRQSHIERSARDIELISLGRNNPRAALCCLRLRRQT